MVDAKWKSATGAARYLKGLRKVRESEQLARRLCPLHGALARTLHLAESLACADDGGARLQRQQDEAAKAAAIRQQLPRHA